MTVDDDVLTVARARLLSEADGIHRLADRLDETFEQAAAALLGCTGKVFVGGSGTSGAVARRMAHVLSVTGTPALFLAPMDSLHGASGAITDEDLMLLVSHGGSSHEVVETAGIARAHGAQVVAMTGRTDSDLARRADLTLLVTVPSQADIGGVIATGITLAQSAYGDALAEVVMRARGYTWEQFMRTHPAGAVGMREELPEDLPLLRLPARAGGGLP
ncbi:KpsF/GutQ family sugar-phosphate isomerase [Serinicoccus chungangensis]|uniref:KpsF/GutQ family sugar-phosphate isomerase n=1 Tax=Serinicoccus chungangensis TaxID=767452 RepID=UPI0013054818|nr:SIS domain-containing protein [Serinicoccus chungangensis]